MGKVTQTGAQTPNSFEGGTAESAATPGRPLWCRALLKAARVQVEYRPSTLRALYEPGPLIVTCNHQSYVDGPIIALASPVPMVFGVDPEFAETDPASSTALRWMEAAGLGRVVPVSSTKPIGLRELVKVLEKGGRVMIFPEGGIAPDGQTSAEYPGVQWMQRRTGARHIRLAIEGAYQSRVAGKAGTRWRPPIRLRF
ncbi:phospholipid/glycerol acyltransferase (plasmid) [Thioalkalivibrio sp. K90mix]|uniref:lysophospholipid acyltransferase family protein n=1 Tax=Thioalkalivibrio sp. (strain K90mix) TaxID=396595 RepID=UPI000195A720|nr:lysophospholipid acyltransferase family protein [Thioalkalivibrio sp. K90mix]ADC73287.1 phospholipid/glycerol acyltransferase [Thioalkalivibrio sp. K90mix]